MKTTLLLASLFALSLGGFTACAADGGVPVAKEALVVPAKPIRVLAFSKTNGFRHAPQIVKCHAMLADFAKLGSITVDKNSGENPAVFTDEVLKNVDVVIFLHTTDNAKKPLLDKAQRAAFEAFIKRGGGWAGIHGATDGGYDWPFYSEMVGAHFKCHPHQQVAELQVVDPKHLSTEHMEPAFKHHEEWYDFDANVALKPQYHLLLKVDEKTYKPKAPMGEVHPIAWTHEYQGGRAWYTELGHTEKQYGEEWFRKHVLGGIQWAAGYDQKAKEPAK